MANLFVNEYIPVSVAEVTAALRRADSREIPDAYYIGTAQRESGFNLGNVSDFTAASGPSVGLYQVNQNEAISVGEDPDNLKDIDTNTRTFVKLAERNRRAIRLEAGIPAGAPDPWDMGAYLGIAHNQGLGAALKTVREYGIDWIAYKARNPTVAIVSGGYGDTVLYTPGGGRIAMSQSTFAAFAVAGVAAFGILYLFDNYYGEI